MDKMLLVLTLWCTPSALLVACASWQRHKAQLRIKALHLDEVFSHHVHRRAPMHA